MKKNTENWLKCTLTAGLFPNEYGVDGREFDETVFCFFVPQEYTKTDQTPSPGKPVQGWVKVWVVERKGDSVLVFLPRQTFQNGSYVTVKADQLEWSVPETPRTAKQRKGRR